MGGHKNGIWADLQGDLQKIPAVQPQYGPAVGMDVSDGLQLSGQKLRLTEAGQENHIVNLSHLSVFLVDGTDLTGDHKPWRAAAAP